MLSIFSITLQRTKFGKVRRFCYLYLLPPPPLNCIPRALARDPISLLIAHSFLILSWQELQSRVDRTCVKRSNIYFDSSSRVQFWWEVSRGVINLFTVRIIIFQFVVVVVELYFFSLFISFSILLTTLFYFLLSTLIKIRR